MKGDVWPVSFGKDQKEYQVIAESIKIICVLCATDPERIIYELTGYAWSEEEAIGIKSCLRSVPAKGDPAIRAISSGLLGGEE